MDEQESQEFPKCLYADGSVDGVTKVASDAAEEKALGKEGFKPLKPAKAD